MIYFITGPSSCGKSRLISKLQRSFPDIQCFSSDCFFKKVWQECKEEWKYKLDFRDFDSHVQETFMQKWVDTLNRLGISTNKLVLVDDITNNISGYLHEIQCPYRIFLLGIPLRRFFLNLRRRKDRRGGQVLKELMDLYEPSPYPTDLKFEKKELESFLELKGYSKKGVLTQIPKAVKHFFKDKDMVYIRPSLSIPLPISKFVCESDLDLSFQKLIRKFIKSLKKKYEKSRVHSSLIID